MNSPAPETSDAPAPDAGSSDYAPGRIETFLLGLGTVGELMAQLVRRPGLPPALMLVGQGSDADRYRDLADAVPVDHGGLALVHKPVAGELPAMVGRRTDGGWQVEVGGQSLAVALGPHGLAPAGEG